MKYSFKLTLAITAATLAMVFATFVFAPQASAGGGVGGGGGAGGCTTCGGSSTNNGYGWYKFSSAAGSERPGGMRDGQNWEDVRSFCRNTGNDSVIAFIILTSSRTPGTANVYKYVDYDFNKYYLYKGDDGGNWRTHEQAKAYYDTIPAGDKVGFTWGRNVAWFCYNFANQWHINGQSYIQKGAANISQVRQGTITAAPGERLNWYHDLRNTGPQAMDRQIYYMIAKTGFSNGWNGISAPNGYVSGGVNSLFVRVYATTSSPYTLYDVTQNDVGNTLCQRINWQAYSWNNGGVGTSGFACANIPYSYALTPTIEDITDGGMIESDAGSIPLKGRVTNSGATKSHTGIQWRITQIKYAPGATVAHKTGGVNAADPCSYFNGNVDCDNIGSGTEAGGYGHNATKAYNDAGSLGDEEVGTKLCFAMSVKRNSSSSANWRHSALRCLTVGKKPKVQVYGGDLIVGRGYASDGSKRIADIMTSVSTKGSTHYGSWGEYGLIPSGTVSGMASGSGYAGGVGTKDLCASLSLLTLTNSSNVGAPTCNSGLIGNYSLTTPSPIDSIASRFAVTGGNRTGNVNVASLTSKTVYSGSGTINLSSSTDIPARKWVVLNAPNANVRITSDIKYTDGTLSSTSDIPQLVIIARNIVIDDDVERVDAWLLAIGQDTSATVKGGILNTCDSSIAEPTKLTSKVCNKQLTVNGPVMANHLYLYRTAGSGVGDDSGTPAEVFNLRPDAYMWASNYAGLQSKARTVYEAELPPRF